MNINKALDKAHEGGSLKDMLSAPISALQGMADWYAPPPPPLCSPSALPDGVARLAFFSRRQFQREQALATPTCACHLHASGRCNAPCALVCANPIFLPHSPPAAGPTA